MAKDDEKEGKDDEKKGGKGKLIIMVLPLVLLIAAGAWFFLLRPKEEDTGPVTLPHPVPGAPIALDPITINLSGAHFLKLGMALQPIAGAHETPDGSKALDLAIAQFSQMSIDDLADTEGREHAKENLVARVKLAYLPHGTDLATAFNGATEDSAEHTATGEARSEGTKESSSTKESETSKESSSEESSEDSGDEVDGVDVTKLTEHALDALTDEQAVKLAAKLSVQPDVYDIYFTEFVMQ